MPRNVSTARTWWPACRNAFATWAPLAIETSRSELLPPKRTEIFILPLMLRRRLTGTLSARLLPLALKQLHDDREKDRGHKNAEERDTDHPAEDRGADRLAHFRPGSNRVHQWEHPERKGEGGHQDGPQAQSGSFNRGVLPILTRIHLL